MILFVENDAKDRLLIQSVLSSWDHIKQVMFVTDGVEALKYLENSVTNFPFVIVIDLQMPKIDGLELIRKIRANSKYSFVPIVMFSSSNQKADIAASYQNGASAYIVKPLGFVEFSRAIKTIMSFWVDLNKT
jgi:two-component system response regulator